MDGWADGWMDGWVGGWVGGWVPSVRLYLPTLRVTTGGKTGAPYQQPPESCIHVGGSWVDWCAVWQSCHGLHPKSCSNRSSEQQSQRGASSTRHPDRLVFVVAVMHGVRHNPSQQHR